MAITTCHGLGGSQGVEHGLFGGFNHGLDEEGKGFPFIKQAFNGLDDFVGMGFATGGGEGNYVIPAAGAGCESGAGQAQRRAPGKASKLACAEWGVGGYHHHAGAAFRGQATRVLMVEIIASVFP